MIRVDHPRSAGRTGRFVVVWSISIAALAVVGFLSGAQVGVLWTKLGFAWRGLDMDYCGLIGWADGSR